MDRMVLPGRAWVACAWLFFTFHVCLGSVTVKVNPKVDVMLEGTAQLPCTYTTSESSSMTVVQWFIETAGTRKRVAYRSSADSGLDKNTPLAGRLSMEDDNTLVISMVKISDQRSFFCQVDGGFVGTSEAETKLNVFFAPQKPVVSGNNQAIPIHQDTASEVGSCTSRNGHPEPRIIWYKDSTPLPHVTDPKEKVYMVPKVVLEPSGLFTITSILYMQLNRADAKSTFHCTVEFEMPNKSIVHESSESFKRELLYAAENAFFTLLNQKPIKEGDEVQMKCETDGSPQPDFEFYKDNKQLDSKNEVLTLSSVTRDQSGTYKCVALDFDAEVTADLTKSLNISVHYLDPVSVVPAGPLLVPTGNAVELQCKTKSSDEYTLSWMKDDKKLSQKGVLSLESVTLADAGEYVCVASVPSVPNLQKSANVTVTVSGKPEIDEPVHGTVTKEGQKVTLRCSVLGHPTPQFTWKPSGKESLTVEGNKYISTVTLPATADVLENGVICEAENQHGAVSKKFMVTVQSGNTIDVGSNGRGSPVFATAETRQGGSSGVVIAVVVCVLLLLLLVATLYFLSKKGKMSCKKDNKQVESRKVNDNIVVEMKTGEKANEESGLLK